MAKTGLEHLTVEELEAERMMTTALQESLKDSASNAQSDKERDSLDAQVYSVGLVRLLADVEAMNRRLGV